MPDTSNIDSRNKMCPGCPDRPDCRMTSTKKYHRDGVYYCVWCAEKLGLRSKITAKTRAKQRQAKTGTKKQEQRETFISQNVSDAMHQRDFDLESQYNFYREVDPNKLYGNAAAILAYSQWYHADAETRIPKTKLEVTNILGVSAPTLYVWEKMKVFKKARSEYLKDQLEYGIGAEIATAVVLENAQRGSEKAIEIRNKIVDSRQKERGGKSDVMDFLDEKDLAEAKAIVGEKKLDKRSNAGKFASEDIDRMLTEGEPIDESKFN